MYYDIYGNPHEQYPGELSGVMRGQNQQNGQNGQNQQRQPPQANQNFRHRQADLIFLRDPKEMEGFEVKPGFDQVFVAEDSSWFAVKSAVGNGYTTALYPRQEPKEPAQVDMSMFVTRAQIEEALPRMIENGITDYVKRQEGKANGTV